MKNLKEKEKKDEFDKTKETQEEELRQTFLQTSMPIHTNMPHTHTNVILHTDSLPHQHFTHHRFYAQKLLHTNTPAEFSPSAYLLLNYRFAIAKRQF